MCVGVCNVAGKGGCSCIEGRVRLVNTETYFFAFDHMPASHPPEESRMIPMTRCFERNTTDRDFPVGDIQSCFTELQGALSSGSTRA
jgi:hypothetical protein